eukprot:1368958-Amphidinium_carterae.2
MFQSLLKSLRSSRMINSVISALFSQTVAFIGGHITKVVLNQLRKSALIKPKGQNEHQSIQRESG